MLMAGEIRMVPREVDYEKIGARIKRLRTEKGLTQAELSDMAGCSNNYLSHVETAQSKVSLSVLLQIATALNTSLDYFLLDTTFARPDAIIETEISQKLHRCRPATLVAINHIIDALLEQEKQLTAHYD